MNYWIGVLLVVCYIAIGSFVQAFLKEIDPAEPAFFFGAIWPATIIAFSFIFAVKGIAYIIVSVPGYLGAKLASIIVKRGDGKT